MTVTKIPRFRNRKAQFLRRILVYGCGHETLRVRFSTTVVQTIKPKLTCSTFVRVQRWSPVLKCCCSLHKINPYKCQFRFTWIACNLGSTRVKRKERHTLRAGARSNTMPFTKCRRQHNYAKQIRGKKYVRMQTYIFRKYFFKPQMR